MKTISLALGSGGARGLAHIGVIHWLEEHDYEIKSISGSSIGSLVGGVYAAGKLDEFEKWVRTFTKYDVYSLLDIAWNRTGLVKGDKLIKNLVNLVGDLRIEDLPIRFTAVATDLNHEKEVWISSGKLFDAIRASVSLPLFFTPYKHNGNTLVDGSVLNPIPIAPTFQDETELTIAVNLFGPTDHKPPIQEETPPSEPEQSDFRDAINRYIRKFQNTITNGGELDIDAYDVANQSIDIMQSAIARQKLAAYPPDHTITIARDVCGILEFERADEMIELGYKSAEETFNHHHA